MLLVVVVGKMVRIAFYLKRQNKEKTVKKRIFSEVAPTDFDIVEGKKWKSCLITSKSENLKLLRP